jgi:hypothetical protein
MTCLRAKRSQNEGLPTMSTYGRPAHNRFPLTLILSPKGRGEGCETPAPLHDKGEGTRMETKPSCEERTSAVIDRRYSTGLCNFRTRGRVTV